MAKAIKKPEISFVEAINLDRVLKADNSNITSVSFSKNGMAPKLEKKNMNDFLKLSFKNKKNSLAKLSKNWNSKENMINGFEELENYEINTINILYANYLLSNSDFHAWKYFFNKYLSTYNGWKIDLEFFKFSNMFDVIKGSTSSKDMYYSDTLVSVIMPVFNNENTISYAVNSILNQTHQNIELIIVDDCSTDTTELICKNLIKNDNRIKYLKNQQNSGAYISRNNGLKIAKGEYITILDGDDWSFPQRIEYQLNQLKNNVNSKAHLGYYIRIHSNGFIDNFKVCTDWCFDGLLSKCLASMMIEKKFFDEVLGYWDSVRFGADSELYYRILAIDEKLIVEDIVPLYLALDRENSLTNSEATKIGGELRSQYAKAFLDFHKNSTLEKLYYTFPQTKRPFVVPNEMELNSTIQIDIAQLSVEPITDLQQLKKIKSNISRFDFLTEEFKYQCLWQLNKKSKYLFVLFHGANDRSKKHPPYFERWSWQNDFNGSILNISDPTLLLDDKLRLGWYIGNKNEYPVETIVSIVNEFANIHGIENSNIIFYGSSGAGYTSLACSRYIPNSNAVAINAQTNVLNYYQGHVSDMLKASFNSTDQNEVWEKYKERLDMVDYYSNNKYSNNIFLVQNEKDEFHYKNHFLPFIEKTNLSKQKILLYSNESGHGPEPRNMVEEILKKLLKNRESKVVNEIFSLNDNFDIYVDDNNFLISDMCNLANIRTKKLQKIINSEFYIFWYCFLDDDIVKNSKITKKQFQYILKNKDKNSGIFVAISKEEENITIVFDPLVQYSMFYHIKNNITTISNNIFLISELHNLKEPEDKYLFDNIGYESPLRGLTVLKDVFAIQFDDLINNKNVNRYKVPLPLKSKNLRFMIQKTDAYSNLTYYQLLKICRENLNKKAKIIAEKFDEVHVQLTGGADSRLVLSFFLSYTNLLCYVYGNGSSQDRLCHEAIVEKFNLKQSAEIIFAGQVINNSSLIFRSLYDSNCRKISGIGLYMNSDDFVFDNKCKITGYYGLNVSGGVKLPVADTKNNTRTNFVPDKYFTYHDYVKFMKTKYANLREASFRDIFYINNRGPSHYGAHSIADNLKSNSFDILYDPINIELVKKCPYTDSEIDGNAISIDLLYMNDPELALFPYDRRKIPRYKQFNNVPTLNCFDGFSFKETVVDRIKVERPVVDIQKFDFLKKGSESVVMLDLIKYEEIAFIFEKYPFLKNIVKKNDTVNATRLLNYVFSIMLLNRYSEL